MSKSYTRRSIFQMAGAAAAAMLGSRIAPAQQAKPDAAAMKGFFATHPDPFPALERRVDRIDCPGRQPPQDDL